MTSFTSDPEGGLSSPLVHLVRGYEHKHFDNDNYFLHGVDMYEQLHFKQWFTSASNPRENLAGSMLMYPPLTSTSWI